MGKLESLKIILDSSSRVYYGGMKITGIVQIILRRPMKVRGIRLELKGEANVDWIEGQSRNKRKRNIHYKAAEKYFDLSSILYGSGPSFGASTVTLKKGEHRYPFEFELPPNIPSSYEGGTGYVRYHMRAIMDKPWKSDHKCKIAFTVIAVLDLNTRPLAPKQACKEGTKHFCCLCCRSGPLSAKVALSRSGFVPGENILINAEISNMSNRQINSTEVIFKMLTTFRATNNKTKHEIKKIASLKQGRIDPGDTGYWNHVRLRIPPLPPSELIYCKIIDIQYEITFFVSIGRSPVLRLPIPILIGTIPLCTCMPASPNQTLPYQPQSPYSIQQQSLPYDMPKLLPTSDPTSSTKLLPPTAPPMSYDGASSMDYAANCPPPNYEECTFGKVNIKGEDDDHTHGELDFAPNYPYYDFGSTI